MLIGLDIGEEEEGEGEEEEESHSKVGTLLGPTIIFSIHTYNITFINLFREGRKYVNNYHYSSQNI